MASQTDVVAQIRATLAATDPDLDTSVGTTTRKIIDAVAESIAEAHVENHMLAYQYDIDSKVDADLDDFTQLFGIARYGAKRATGTVVFSRGSGDANRPILIPVATQVGSTTIPQVVVATIAPTVMDVGQTSVSVPVQAIVGGPEGNVGAGLLTQLLTPVDSVSTVTNIEGLTGGAERETDTQLRARWKRTVFRSLAGTEQMYLGIALNDGIENPDTGCTQANVVGASKRYREVVQVASGSAVSQVDDAQFIYADSSLLGDDIDSGDILVRNVHYTFDNTHVEPDGRIAPTVTSKNSGLSNGSLYELDFEYLPKASRNNPAAGINNRIDVWCSGVRAREVVQTVIFQSGTDFRFSDDPASPLYRQKFTRDTSTAVTPTLDNIFIPLAWGPIVTVPDTIIIGGVTYTKGSSFHVVHQSDAFGYSPTSLFGIEVGTTSIPPNGSVFTLTYTYNEVPHDIQRGIDSWRLVGTDAKAHQAKLQRLTFNLAVMYSSRADKAATDSLIGTTISKFLSSLGFNSTLQASDIIDAIHGLAGVDNIRFLNGNDYATYDTSQPNDYKVGIQRLHNGSVVESYVDAATGRVKDKTFGDDELPVFDSLYVVTKAQNTFGF